MASHLSTNKKFWAKDMGNRGVVIKDLTSKYHDVVQTHPKVSDKEILNLLAKLDGK